MGWAKYAEDNFDAFYERQALKGGESEIPLYPFTSTQQQGNRPQKESSFAERNQGKSCFSL